MDKLSILVNIGQGWWKIMYFTAFLRSLSKEKTMQSKENYLPHHNEDHRVIPTEFDWGDWLVQLSSLRKSESNATY